MPTELEMSTGELEAFLRETRFASVTTMKANGWPVTIPLGFLYENGAFYLTIKAGRGLITRVARDPRMCILVANETFPTIAAICSGEAEFVDDPGDSKSKLINLRYMSSVPELDVDAFMINWLAGGRRVLRLRPATVVSWDSRKKADYVAEAGITISELRRARPEGEGG